MERRSGPSADTGTSEWEAAEFGGGAIAPPSGAGLETGAAGIAPECGALSIDGVLGAGAGTTEAELTALGVGVAEDRGAISGARDAGPGISRQAYRKGRRTACDNSASPAGRRFGAPPGQSTPFTRNHT